MYFENGFACRMRLRNTGPNEQQYGPAPVRYRRNNLIFIYFFLEINFNAMISHVYPSDTVNVTSKFLLK